jgi:PAS domain S-box-containing protein
MDEKARASRDVALAKLIWQASGQSMCLTDERGAIIEANDAFRRMAAAPLRSLEGVEMATLFGPEDQQTVRDLQKEHSGFKDGAARTECQLHFPGGRSGWFEVSTTMLGGRGQATCFLNVFEDVTEHKRGAQELARAKETIEIINRDLVDANRYLVETGSLAHEMAERAAALNVAKSEFLSNMTHEFRTPLNGITGMVELAILGDLQPEQREYLQLAKTSADALLGLVNDVLDYSRYEAGKLALNPSEFSLRSLLQHVLGPLAERAAAKHLPLEWAVAADAPDQLLGDSARLAQVIGNLTGNAIKFTSSGRVAVNVRATSLHSSSVALHFTVSDTGVGIAREKQRMIFQPFAQADGSTTRKYGGAGLGLSIASVLVELMGGQIWLESQPGQGTTFHFTAVLDSLEPVSAPARQKTWKHRTRILVAEDNIVNQRLATRLLEHEGYLVEVADNGRQALEMLDHSHFDVVLMDIQMPELDGLQATAQIRKKERGSLQRLPVVAITAQTSQADRQQCFEAGMDAYVTKPVRVPELMSTIESVVPGGSLMDDDKQHPGSVEEQLHQLDESLALSRVGGDFDLLREVVELFLSDYPQSLEKIRAAVEARDPTELEHHAHSLKGSVSTFGAKEAFEAALELEKKGRSGDLSDAEDGLYKLEYALQAIRPQLEAIQNR